MELKIDSRKHLNPKLKSELNPTPPHTPKPYPTNQELPFSTTTGRRLVPVGPRHLACALDRDRSPLI